MGACQGRAGRWRPSVCPLPQEKRCLTGGSRLHDTRCLSAVRLPTPHAMLCQNLPPCPNDRFRPSQVGMLIPWMALSPTLLLWLEVLLFIGTWSNGGALFFAGLTGYASPLVGQVKTGQGLADGWAVPLGRWLAGGGAGSLASSSQHEAAPLLPPGDPLPTCAKPASAASFPPPGPLQMHKAFPAPALTDNCACHFLLLACGPTILGALGLAAAGLAKGKPATSRASASGGRKDE